MALRAITILAVLSACGGPSVVSSSGGLRFEGGALDFGQPWVGHSGLRHVRLRNEARAARTATLSVQAPFTLAVAQVEVAGGGSVEVVVSVVAGVAGPLDGALILTTEAGAEQLPLTGRAISPPTCPPALPCHAVAFDPVAGACVDALLPDGASCSGDACVENAQCQAGLCKGTALGCDDANACTVDSCGADGCAHATRACPAPAGPCQVPTCEPANGCATQAAPDGTRCGAGDCVEAHVCIAGACVVRPVPEGAACGPATPCTSAPTCHGGACLASPAKQIAEVWSYTPADGARITSFGSQDTHGNFYLLELTGAAPLLQAALVSLTRDGAVRFKVDAGAPNVTVQRGPIDTANQQQLLISAYRSLEARSLADGKLSWSADFFDALKPLFDRGVGATYNFSITQVTIVSATTAILAVHEDAGPWRSWVVGVSLLTGKILWTREHPGHLSSFVATAQGDLLYLESHEQPTLFALSPAGALLWSKRLPANVVASALSLVDGKLLLRGLNQWLDATTGTLLGTLGSFEAGHLAVGAGDTAWVASAQDGLTAFDLRTLQPRFTVPAHDGVVELLLATGGAALAITSPRGVYPAPPSTLVGFDAKGGEEFRCKTSSALDPWAVLDQGRLVGRLGNRIAALSLPALSPAPQGWISSRGSFLRTGRAR